MNREDAEEALEACNDTDPFNVGRLLTMRWGKNVKKNVRRGTGGLVEAAMRNREGEPKTPKTPSTNTGYPSGFGDLAGKLRPDGLPHVIMLGDPEMQDISQAKPYDPKIHSTGAIRVETPKDETRFHFISTVASYVAKDGIEIEKRLLEEESGNSLFNFLTLDNADERQRKENLFYRWRVFSFSQGDSYSIWRTEPFVMFHPNGRYWIPPPLNLDAVKREKALAKEGKDRYRQEKEDRVNSQQYTTGRQVERARYLRRKGRGQYGENASKLSPEDLLEFDRLVKKELSISREKICKAMAFCFDKCLAAKDISALLKETLLDDSHHVTIDMRIARLYLLSDILFNSQQPGIKNAFMYRSTIEAMAPEIFRSLGKYRESSIGRMTINKMRRAVSAVLCAWTDWGVYNVTFMDELEAHYEGREVKHDTGIDVEGSAPVEEDTKMSDPLDQSEEEGQFITSGPRGDWVEVTDMTDKGSSELVAKEFPPSKREGKSLSGDCISPGAGNVNHASVAGTDPKNVSSEVFEDVDGEPIEEADADIDGEPIDMDHVEANVDGEALDGDALDGEDLDGDAIDEGDVDGEEIDGDDL
jgi:U2-associated protein SR140